MALQRTRTFVLLLTFVWLICQLANDTNRLKWLMRAFILGTAILIANLYLLRALRAYL